MRHPRLGRVDAESYLSGALDRETLLSTRVNSVGTGADLDEGLVATLTSELERLKFRVASAEPGVPPDFREFESRAPEVAHRLLTQLPAFVLADSGFWTWLAVVPLEELVRWRYSGAVESLNLKNFGVGAPLENFVFRLWLRGELGFEPGSDDPYALSRRGDIDFWRSHIFRPHYGASREFVKALVEFQFPSDRLTNPTLGRLEIRELSKRLKRLRANVLLDMMDRNEASALIQKLAADVRLEFGAQ